MATAKAAAVATSSSAIPVCSLHEEHPRIRAADWRGPLIHRLLKGAPYQDGPSQLSDSYKGPRGAASAGTLDLGWNKCRDEVELCARTYQEPVLTEFATLALACALLTRHTDLRITEVTRRGEAVDYWIGTPRNHKRFVLEVGGLQDGNIDALSQEKAEQLARNPWNRSGYICVAVYNVDAARLWYCEEEEP